MARDWYKTSAPGTLMMLGEHAVLRGAHALVCAIDRRVRVALAPRTDQRVHIASALGRFESDLDSLPDDPRVRFVTAAIRSCRTRIPSGMDLAIQSDFSHKVGFGSSAAVTVAVSAALRAWLGLDHDACELVRASRAIIRDVQGSGSGADAAAAVLGGIVLYRMEPFRADPLDSVHPITVVYSGHKEPTADVIRQVDAAYDRQPHLFDGVFDLMNQSTVSAAEAVRKGDWRVVGNILDINQGLMDAIGVNTPELSNIVFALRSNPDILGAKISGAGLGDCALGLGEAAREAGTGDAIPVAMSREGVTFE